MRFENIKCDGCGRTFEKNDDIVVCPVCGTPQHRECWELSGGCINKDKHAEGFEWKMPESKKAEIKKEASMPEKTVRQETVLHSDPMLDVGMEREIPNFDYVVESRVRSLAPGISEEQRREQLCGHNLSDVIAFIGNNASSYVNKFRKKEHAKRNTFNFGAFFFCPIWFFFRRLYKEGIIYLAVTLCLTMLMAGPSESYMTLVDSIMASGMENITDAQYAELMNASAPIMLYGILNLVIKLIAGLTGDRMYYRYCKDSLTQINELKKTADNTELLHFYLKKSSTAFLATLIAMAAYYFLPGMLMSLFVGM